MQVSVETTSGLERRLTITIPADQIEVEMNKRIQQVAPSVNINGFRKGKVPLKVVKQRYGAGIRQEVLGDMMSNTFQEAVVQEQLKPAGRPAVETKDDTEGRDFSFVATFEVYPEIDIKPLEGVTILKPVSEITDADVDEMIENLRSQQATFEDVERAAANDDQVNIDYKGEKDGEAFDGGTAEGSTLVLGSGQMIPGFEDGIVGMTPGEEKVLSLSFPEDYHAEELKGVAVEFTVKLNSVSEKKLPELDDEFFKKFGVEEGGLDGLKTHVRKNMEKELKNALKQRVKNQVMDALLEKNPIDVPKSLIDGEIDQMRRQMVQQFSQGQPMDNFDYSLLPAEMFQERAERRVNLGLILSKALETYEVKAESDEVRKAVEELASDYDASEEIIDWYYKNDQQLAQIESMVLEDKVVDKLLEAADTADENIDYKALIEAVNAQSQ
ncbi:MAG: trigger factor, partial [Cellvibrionales bacterium]|nr:trigger factor [Cellvibrionales bacterium]